MNRNRTSTKTVQRTGATPRLKKNDHQNGTMLNGHNGLSADLFRTNHDLIDTQAIVRLENHWRRDARWQGISRPYSPEKVLRLRGTLAVEHTIAERMARKLWDLLESEDFVPALGALTGNQDVQMAQASPVPHIPTKVYIQPTVSRW